MLNLHRFFVFRIVSRAGHRKDCYGNFIRGPVEKRQRWLAAYGAFCMMRTSMDSVTATPTVSAVSSLMRREGVPGTDLCCLGILDRLPVVDYQPIAILCGDRLLRAAGFRRSFWSPGRLIG
jgi:hypothetical protein